MVFWGPMTRRPARRCPRRFGLQRPHQRFCPLTIVNVALEASASARQNRRAPNYAPLAERRVEPPKMRTRLPTALARQPIDARAPRHRGLRHTCAAGGRKAQKPPRGPGSTSTQRQVNPHRRAPARAAARAHTRSKIAARERQPPRSRKTRKTAPKNNPETMARQPRIPMKSEIEQALLVLEHTERSTLVDCGADKRIRQLFKTTSYKTQGPGF